MRRRLSKTDQSLWQADITAKAAADAAMDKFLSQAVADGRLTDKEQQRLSPKTRKGKPKTREEKLPVPLVPHYEPHKTFYSFADFAAWRARKDGDPIEGVYERLTATIREKDLDRLTIELYINSTEYSVEELAKEFGIKVSKVKTLLSKVRKTWPEMDKSKARYRNVSLSTTVGKDDERTLSEKIDDKIGVRALKTYGDATTNPCDDPESVECDRP